MRRCVFALLLLLIAGCKSTKLPTALDESAFEGSIKGQDISLYRLQNEAGMQALISNYGARLVSLRYPGANEQADELIVNLPSLKAYQQDESKLGALSGMFVNRVWQVEDQSEQSLKLRYQEGNGPFCEIKIQLTAEGKLQLDYQSLGPQSLMQNHIQFLRRGPQGRWLINEPVASQFYPYEAKTEQEFAIINRPDPIYVKAATYWPEKEGAILEMLTQSPSILLHQQENQFRLSPNWGEDFASNKVQTHSTVYHLRSSESYAFPPLANGFDDLLQPGLPQFYTWLREEGKDRDPREVFSLREGQLYISGEQFGYLCTRRNYTDFHFVSEWRWGEKRWPPRESRPRDSGICYYFADDQPDKIWPRSLEYQIQEADCGDY
ncbi:MAG: family 16 glycoside hydrolase, partial [Bacteroidota bacterium]